MKKQLSTIIAAVFMLAGAQAAHASDISIAWQGNAAQAGVALQAFDTRLSTTEAVFDDYALQLQYTNLTSGTSFAAFCIEPLAGNSVLPATYSVSSFSGVEASHLAALYQTSFSTSMNATQQAAFQLAVWEFTQESSTFGTQTGAFVSQGPSAVTTLADSYLAAALSFSGTSSYQVTKLTSGDYQDLVFATAVPEPGTYALFLAGLGAIGMIARRRLPR
ncbi:PEP-CTERM sorting domain-containing protein [Roseateles sp. DC23W]|uniref:PEP-CTERM sorting domain-containing protein n=1 Tax=Pelomonas dachongensis TaxID=3299029 RepID=A0ABW7ESF4_9BURK